jgi:serine phosphatase RsbU (regulator of sigma subunit)
MFGKHALFEVIRRNSDLSAADIVAAVVAAVNLFQAGVQPEDDITLVVAKLNLHATNLL